MSSYDDEDQDDMYWQSSKVRTVFNFNDEDDESKDIKQFAEKGRKSLQDDGDDDSLSGFTGSFAASKFVYQTIHTLFDLVKHPRLPENCPNIS